MSEKVLVVGKRGEIFTTKRLRQEAKIREGGKVRASIVGGKLVLEPVPSIKELLSRPVLTSDVKTTERLSEEAQKEAGAYG